MNRKEFILGLPLRIFAAMLLVMATAGQVRAQMTLQIKDMPHGKAILVENFGEQMFVIDTLVANAKGIFRSGSLQLRSGRLYSLILPDHHYANLDFIYDGYPLKMKTTAEGPITHMQVKKYPGNEALYTDAAAALPLLTALNELVMEESTGNSSAIDSLLSQLKALRAEHLRRFAGTSWARTFQLDDSQTIPWHNIREFGNLMRSRDAGGQTGEFLDRLREGDRRQALDPLYENRLRHMIRRNAGSADSIAPALQVMLERAAGDLLILRKLFDIVDDELIRQRNLGFEQFLIGAWDGYFSRLSEQDRTDKALRTAGEFVRILRDNPNGSPIGDIDVRTPDFEKTGMQDILEGNWFTILVFYDLKNQGHLRAILDWRDAFNRSGLYNKNVKLVFISIHQEENKWVNAIHNLNILDHINYLDWMGNESTDRYYHPLVADDIPVTYLVDQQGRIISKLSRDITDYFPFMTNE